MTVSIYYDGDCPFCTRFATYLRLKDAVGAPRLVDLREDDAAREGFIRQGIDVDKGMVADIDGKLYWGKDAVHALALITGPVGAFNRLTAVLFSSPAIAAFSYPILRAGRNFTLDLLGRHQMVENDAKVEAKNQLFALFFGLFSIFHVLSFPNYYNSFPPPLDFLLLFVLAIALVIWPRSRGLLIGVMAASLLSGWLNAPVESNHTMLRNVVALGFAGVYLINLLHGQSWQRTFLDFSVVGQGGLLVMYFYGVFHKINTGFLDPAVSCAVVLWRDMPPPLSWIDFPLMHYAAIYGTLVIETAMLIALLMPRFRNLAIAAGIFFHLVLALSNFSVYLPFTTLVISLHLLFLSPESAWRVVNSPVMQGFSDRLRQPAWLAVAAIYLAVMCAGVLAREFTLVTLMASVFVLPLCYAILRYGMAAEKERLPAGQRASRFGRTFGGALAALFFIACLSPYLGLKSAQNMNMFSNLRTEGGVSNHLVFSSPPSLFPYLDDVVTITRASGDALLEGMAGKEYGLVRYDLLQMLRARPDVTVSYRLNGVEHVDQSAATLADEIERTLFSKRFNKFFNFIPVRLMNPAKC